MPLDLREFVIEPCEASHDASGQFSAQFRVSGVCAVHADEARSQRVDECLLEGPFISAMTKGYRLPITHGVRFSVKDVIVGASNGSL